MIAALLGILAGAASSAAPSAARSVHFRWRAPDAELFYNQVLVLESVPSTYFAVAGFDRGYFGVQQHADKDMVIFSVWDSRSVDDPKSVAAEDRVEVLSSDPQAAIKRFGGEGTGAQCKYPVEWKIGETYRFLLKARVEGKKTAYTAWFYLNGSRKWRRLATFRAHDGGSPLHGLYSFVEDFRRDGKSPLELRRARFGPGWVRTTEGKWEPIVRARFTADDAPLDNIDASTGSAVFELATGGDIGSSTQLDAILEIPRPLKGPPDDLPDEAVAPSPVSVESVERCLSEERKLDRFVELEPKRKECFALAVAMSRSDRSLHAKRVYTKAMGELCAADCAARYAADYDENYRPLVLELHDGSLDRDSLDLLFDAVRDVAFTTLDPAHTRALGLIFAVLEARGQATDAQTRDLYEQWVAAREFEAARTLIARRPVKDAPSLPQLEEPSAIPAQVPKVYDISPDGKKARLLPMKQGLGPSIIVVVNCHFSDDAISAIEKDAVLKEVFEKHSLLITPQHELQPASQIADWNRKHPAMKSFVVYKESEWPAIKSWDMPHFYFINGGRVVFDFGGFWGRDEPKDLWKGLRLIGLSP